MNSESRDKPVAQGPQTLKESAHDWAKIRHSKCVVSFYFWVSKFLSSTSKVKNLLNLYNTNNYANCAPLKALTTTPPMTAAQHSTAMRKRTEARRMIEDAKEKKAR